MAALHFIGLCLAWYAASATASNVGKHLLTLWDQPVTASWIQFLFTSMYAFLSAKVFRITTLQPPSRRVFAVVVPLCAFQVGSHVLTSIAISRVPVSFVHTVKALSPLFTVLAYRLLFSVTYPPRVYTAMIPLTLGVMLACAKALDVQFVGVLCALGSCIIYVAQNIFSKRVLFRDEGVTPNSAAPPRMDKINLLFWSSISAFIVMTPGWLWSEGFSLLFSSSSHSIGFSHIFFLLMLNGTAHFAQALLAITVLSTSSPVTYSIASLMKRVVVITCAVLWFRQPIGLTQACGITMTFYGLWLYDRAKGDVRRGERIVERRYDSVFLIASIHRGFGATLAIPREDPAQHRLQPILRSSL
ncbi:MAG: triose-phosphate transporter family-domain-containing protein [Piptocephalis tieghemiana]|nr:MAG: triose-phosphate transporter family-domain-containing protein [Piptocephalis tieghemiana]